MPTLHSILIEVLLFLKIPIICAIIANVWIELLTPEDKLFDWLKYQLSKLIKSRKIRMMLFECAACLSGQLALWIVIISIIFSCCIDYPILTIIFSIYLGAFLSKPFKLKNERI